MTRRFAIFIICSVVLVAVPAENRQGFAADVETAGDLSVQGTVRAGGGITFSDNSTQTSACSGCANGVLSIALGGTGASSALQARTNLAVPGLSVPNTFTGDQTVNANLSLTGNLYLPATSLSAGAIFFGANAIIHSYGSDNFFAGVNAGNRTMTGAGNSAIGSNALYSNTTGGYNTANGYNALYHNTDGSYNAANGLSALFYNTTGSYNAANGAFALYYNTAGLNNTADGYLALFSNTTAGRNTALGAISLYLQDFSNDNTSWNSDNTAIGYEALRNNKPTATTNGIQNTAVGSNSLRNNSTGKDNTASGYFALYGNTSGSYNTSIGHDSLSANTTGQNNAAIGYAAGKRNTTGNANTYVGAFADAGNEALSNATAIGQAAIVDASNHVQIGNAYVTQIGGPVGWTQLSDRRTKTDISDTTLGLPLIKALRPVEFRRKTGNGRLDLGFIAQDVEALMGTEYNVLGIGSDPDQTLSLRYTDFIAPMVKAMQEQQEMIDALKKEVEELKRLLMKSQLPEG